jgi:hypothetical protein
MSSGVTDVKKLLFDCVRSRLSAEIKNGGDQWEKVELVLVLFYERFECFAEDRYFEHLEDLMAHYRHRASEAGKRIEYFASLVGGLLKLKEDLGNPEARMPEGIERLPLVVQRHLAREEPHLLDRFVLHPDPRIAIETFAHIDLNSVTRVLRYRSMNAALLGQLLKTEGFFTRPQNVILAVHHPMCDMHFFERHVSGVDRNELERLANDLYANPAIRAKAKARLGNRPGSIRRLGGN